jgi:two-component sensor histidine kinase
MSVRPYPPLQPWLRFGLALGLTLFGFGLRWLLDPVFGEAHAYTVFYPCVILGAYFLGAGPAALTAGTSAVIAYWCFARPAMHWKTDLAGLTTLLFFLLTSTVSIYFITGMARALRDLAAERARAEDLARSHTALFRDLNERVTNHLQLVAALLQLQARDEADPPTARALTEASARTLLISRVHRAIAGEAVATLDFDTFARELLDATLAARGNPPIEVEIDRRGLELPLEQATSVAIVLLECLHGWLEAGAPARLQVRLSGDACEFSLEVEELGPAGGPDKVPVLRDYLIDAIVEQLGGRFFTSSRRQGAVSTLAFPRQPSPSTSSSRPAGEPGEGEARTVH